MCALHWAIRGRRCKAHVLLYAVFFTCGPSDNLDIYALYLVAFESLAAEVRFDHSCKILVQHILEDVVFPVIEVCMVEGVHIEVHLVVGTHPMVVHSQHGKLCQYVVDGCYRYFCLALCEDFFSHHVGRSMSENHHGLVHGKSLWCGFQ